MITCGGPAIGNVVTPMEHAMDIHNNADLRYIEILGVLITFTERVF